MSRIAITSLLLAMANVSTALSDDDPGPFRDLGKVVLMWSGDDQLAWHLKQAFGRADQKTQENWKLFSEQMEKVLAFRAEGRPVSLDVFLTSDGYDFRLSFPLTRDLGAARDHLESFGISSRLVRQRARDSKARLYKLSGTFNGYMVADPTTFYGHLGESAAILAELVGPAIAP